MQEVGLVVTVQPKGYRPKIDKLLSHFFSVPVNSSPADILEIAERRATEGQRLSAIYTAKASRSDQLLWQNNANGGVWVDYADAIFHSAKRWR